MSQLSSGQHALGRELFGKREKSRLRQLFSTPERLAVATRGERDQLRLGLRSKLR